MDDAAPDRVRTIGSDTDVAGLDFDVLGPVEVRNDDGPLPAGGPRQRSILALLIANAGRPVSLDRIVEGIYGGEVGAGRIVFMDGTTLEHLAEITSAHDGGIAQLSMNEEGTLLATAGPDGFVRVWDVGTRALVHEIPVSDGPVGGVATDGEHVLATIAATGELRRYTIDPDELLDIAPVSGHEELHGDRVHHLRDRSLPDVGGTPERVAGGRSRCRRAVIDELNSTPAPRPWRAAAAVHSARAEPGQTVVSEATGSALEAPLDCGALESALVKGRATPVRAYRFPGRGIRVSSSGNVPALRSEQHAAE